MKKFFQGTKGALSKELKKIKDLHKQGQDELEQNFLKEVKRARRDHVKSKNDEVLDVESEEEDLE